MIKNLTDQFHEKKTHFKLSDGLAEFPQNVFEYSESLIELDLSGNHLSTLPDDFWKFGNLRILFLSNNDFASFPKVLGKMKNLDIIGFKANKIKEIPEDALPENLRWLILTDNAIEELPISIGNCSRLQKLMLAGNRLSQLPEEMSKCKNLELLRISANRLKAIPDWLFSLPKLTWLAYAGNPASSIFVQPLLAGIDWNQLTLAEQLGQGASGFIYKASWNGKDVAVKLFKGEVTSDGWPSDEMHVSIHAQNHPNIARVLAEIQHHPEGKRGLVFEFISPDYRNLGLPPNFETCTRDTFPQNSNFTCSGIVAIAYLMASALKHLHGRGIMHGDFYAHNILCNNDNNALLSDFGAATRYDRKEAPLASKLERLDVRAFGCLVDDLLLRVADHNSSSYSHLTALRDTCFDEILFARPSFDKISTLLMNLKNEPNSI
jgi:tRNA A-37 threonylcarbamoyl transferase component Bud32